MKDIEVIRYLLDEMESEIKYNQEYEKAEKKASLLAEPERTAKGLKYVGYWEFMPKEFDRSPRKSVIKANSLKIRQLMLKMYQS